MLSLPPIQHSCFAAQSNRFGIQQRTIVTSVATDSLNNIYVAGQFNGRVIFGNDTLWAASNDFDIFLAQYNDNGNLQYGKRFGGIYNDTNPKLGIGTFGKIVMAGTFMGLLNLDAQTSIQTNNVDSDIFLVTLTQNGDLLTSNQYGYTNNETLINLTVNKDDYYLSGYFDTFTKINDFFIPAYYSVPRNLLIRTTHTDLVAQPNVVSYFAFDLPSSIDFVAPYTNSANSEIVIAGIFQGTINLPIAIPSPVSNGFTDIFMVTMTLPPVATTTISNDLIINVFPNPATDFITIDWGDFPIYSTAVVEVINAIGQVEQRLSISNENRIQVPIYHLPKGIYFLKVKIDEEQIVKQFIKN